MPFRSSSWTVALCLAAVLVAALVPFATGLAGATLVLVFVVAPLVLEPLRVRPVRVRARQRAAFLRRDPFRGPPVR